VLPYRIVYVIGFFCAAIVDTSLVWLFAAITIAFMTLPNLFTILMLRREMREIIADYWEKFREEYPNE
jgi:AGCS family alanine or glycine:cation symporter